MYSSGQWFDTITYVPYVGPRPAGWDKIGELFLGKDAYLIKQMDLESFLGFGFLYWSVGGDGSPILSDQYDPLSGLLLNRMTVKGINDYTQNTWKMTDLVFENKLSADGRLESIKVTTVGSTTLSYTFTYF